MKRLHLLTLLAVIILLGQSSARFTFAQTTYIVDTTADIGIGSLRDAINSSNGTFGQDTIAFNIPGAGPHIITPLSALPIVTDSIIIDGLTQPSSSCAAPLIVLDGSAGVANGIEITAGFSQISGLVINGFSSAGIVISTNGGNTIECSFIGTNAAGTSPVPNGTGIQINSGINTIGNPGLGNVISGNTTSGIALAGAGTNGNIISYNKVGTDVTGASAVGNGGEGILAALGASNTTITNNVIANNGTSGVAIGISTADTSTFTNLIQQNSIVNNGGLGIDLGNNATIETIDGLDFDSGPNQLQNQPTLSGAFITSSTIDVVGNLTSLPSTNFTIDVYANSVCDGSGSGEGETYVGTFPVTTDGAGSFNFNGTVPAVVASTQFISVTAIDPSNNTSEFSNCVPVTVTTPGFDSLPLPGGTLNMTTPYGTPTSDFISVSETGNGTLNVGPVTLSGGGGQITSTTTNFYIQDGKPAINYLVFCDGSAVGTFTATLTMPHNAAGSPATYTINCTVTAPGYGSSPTVGSTINVGAVAVSGTVSTNLQIFETGTDTLTVNPLYTLGGTNPTDFSVAGFPISINDGAAPQNLTISCTPLAPGARSATLTLTTNDPTQISVNYDLTCTGATPGFASNPLPAPAGATFDFGSVTVGSTSAAQTITITETGGATLSVGLTSLSDNVNFTETGLPITIPDGDVTLHQITLTCNPTTTGTLNATLTLTTNDPANASVTYNLTCVGIPPATPGFASNPLPAPAGATFDFGSVTVGSTSAAQTITITETGNATLSVGLTSLSDNVNFTETGLPITIPDGDVTLHQITLTCNPTTTGTLNATLTLTTNDPANASVTYNLTCVGIPPATPGFASNPLPAPAGATFDFGSVTVGSTSAAQTITITETGNATLSVGLTSLSDNVNFTETGLPITIPDGDVTLHQITLTCNPTTTGTLNATLTLTTNDPANASVTYNLTCVGIPPATPGFASNPLPAPAGATFDFGSVTVGSTSAAQTITITETGNATLSVGLTSLSDNVNFTETGLPITIPDGDVTLHQITLTCNPTTTGTLNATLTLTTNDPANASVTYNLTCVGTLPVYTSINPSLGNPMNFTTVPVNSPSYVTMRVTNSGTGTLTVDTPVFAGTNSTDFSIFSGLPLSLGAGVSGDIVVQCIPSSPTLPATPPTLSLNTNTNNVATDPAVYQLNCVGTIAAGYSSSPAAGTIAVPGTINVGSTLVGSTVSTTLLITETGNTTLTVSDGAPSISGTNATDFALTTILPLNIANGSPTPGTANVGIQCTPTAAGARTATLRFNTNDPTQATVAYTLTCTGVASAAAGYGSSPAPNSTINMTAAIGSGVTVSIVVSETGNATLNVTTPVAGSITGTNAADFSIIVGAPPFSIADGAGTQTVTIRCIPASIGQRLAILSFNTNDPTQPTVSYNLSCVGTSVTDANATATPVGGVAPTPTITIPMSPTPTPLGPAQGQVTGVRGLAVRTGPYLGATIVGVIRPGATYSILAQSQDEGIYVWYMIRIGPNLTGWVSGRYFQTSGNVAVVATQSTIFDQIDNAPDTGVTARANAIIDIRRRPSGRTAILTQIPVGATVSVIGRTMQGGVFWLHIRYNGYVGWIPAAPVDISGNLDNVPIR